MARRRMIDPRFWDDEDVGSLCDQARLLLLCCISQADDYGKLIGSASSLKKIAFGFTDVTTSQVERLLVEIEQCVGGFCRYEVDDKSYIALLHWHRFQRVDHPQPSSFPEPPRRFDPPKYIGTRLRSENDSENDSETDSRQVLIRLSNEVSEDNKRKECAPAAAPLSLHPIVRAYQDAFYNGAPMPESKLRKVQAKFVELGVTKHPRYESELCDPDRAAALIQWWTDKRYDGEIKPLSYLLPAIIDHLDESAFGGNSYGHTEPGEKPMPPLPPGITPDSDQARVFYEAVRLRRRQCERGEA